MGQDDASLRAKASLLKGAREVFRAAQTAVGAVKREISGKDLAKTVDEGGKEILRAFTNVATVVGGGLQDWGKKAQESLDGEASAASQATDGDWPTTREEYERRYGKVGEEWPRTRQEYERRYGSPEKPKGPTDEDPGFRIAGD